MCKAVKATVLRAMRVRVGSLMDCAIRAQVHTASRMLMKEVAKRPCASSRVEAAGHACLHADLQAQATNTSMGNMASHSNIIDLTESDDDEDQPATLPRAPTTIPATADIIEISDVEA